MVFDRQFEYEDPLAEPHQGVLTEFVDFPATHQQIGDETTHDQLQMIQPRTCGHSEHTSSLCYN